MSRLARHRPVLFIEEPVCDAGPPRLDSSWQGRSLEVLTPRTPLPAQGFDAEQALFLRPLLRRALQDRGFTAPLAWLYTPMALPVARALDPVLWVYDCMDELSAFMGAPPELPEREREFMGLADLVLTGGPALYEAKRPLHPRVHCMPSAVDVEHFQPAVQDPVAVRRAEQLQGALGRPRLGFFGVIDERMDLDLIARLADARPHWQLLMVGPVVKIDPGSLPRRPNVHWLGMQSYQTLPALMAGWDVCLMPFALNESTRFISPTKTLEYLAGEKPVVSTPVPDVERLYGAVVRLAGTSEAFIEACEQALGETPARRRQRLTHAMDVVASYSWDGSAQVVHELLQDALRERHSVASGHLLPQGGVRAATAEGAAAAPVPRPQAAAVGSPVHAARAGRS